MYAFSQVHLPAELRLKPGEHGPVGMEWGVNRFQDMWKYFPYGERKRVHMLHGLDLTSGRAAAAQSEETPDEPVAGGSRKRRRGCSGAPPRKFIRTNGGDLVEGERRRSQYIMDLMAKDSAPHPEDPKAAARVRRYRAALSGEQRAELATHLLHNVRLVGQFDCWSPPAEFAARMDYEKFLPQWRGAYDFIACGLTLHYAFANEGSLRHAMENAAACLKPGGVLYGMVTDGGVLACRYSALTPDEDGNRVWQVEDPEHQVRVGSAEPPTGRLP
jgi:hypothetical protein